MAIDPQRLCQVEIHVSDLQRSLHFYREAFGWERVPADIHEYTVLAVPHGCPFGISLVVHPGLSTAQLQGANAGQVVLYFGVDEPAEVITRVLAAGGTLRFGPHKIGAYGEVYQVTDPDGLRLGLYKA